MNDWVRYATDPDYREAYKAVERARYWNDPAHRQKVIARVKERYRNNPDVRRRHNQAARRWAKSNESYRAQQRDYNRRRYHLNPDEARKRRRQYYRDVQKAANAQARRVKESMIEDLLRWNGRLRTAYEEQVQKLGRRPSLDRRLALAVHLFDSDKSQASC